MDSFTPDFSLDVQSVRGFCPAGDAYAKAQMEAEVLPVLSCEGPCIRGEIARLASSLVAEEVPDRIIAKLQDDGAIPAVVA